MKTNLSPLHRFAEQIKPFLFPTRDEGEDPFGHFLRSLKGSLPRPPSVRSCAGSLDIGPEVIREHLDAVHQFLKNRVAPYMHGQENSIAIENLSTSHAFHILFKRSHLVDALHQFAFELAVSEVDLLASLVHQEHRDELEAKRKLLIRKEGQLTGVQAQRSTETELENETPAQREYYEKIQDDLETELFDLKVGTNQLGSMLPKLEGFRFSVEEVGQRLVLFGRGGYGRAELSFSSDVDTGYCLDTEGLEPGENLIFQEIVRRTERLVAATGLSTVHQYFELDEDLSRFGRPDTLHTVPAILESRTIAGNSEILHALKGRFHGVVSFDALVRKKVEEYNAQPRPDLTRMDLKGDWGGLRTIQIPLWLLGITHKADSFMTTDLLQLARQQKVLSLWEVSKLLLGLEFLNHLRNFTGAAEAYYYDREARESGFNVQQFFSNRVDDQIVRLYLFRCERFATLDAFDAYRLQLVEEVQRIAARMMDRVLDRMITKKTGELRIAVHLGRRCIDAINSAHNGGSAELRALFQDGRSILTLFAFVSETDYDLSDGLKDALAGAVLGLTYPDRTINQAEQVALFNDLMLAPYAHRALASMLEVNDSLAPGMPSLLGRFIPTMDKARFLVRRFDGKPMVMHRYMLKAVESGQVLLEELDRDHPDLGALLERDDRLALKWSLFLIGVGRIGDDGSSDAKSAEVAAEVLAGMGFREQELERKVRMMIEHHGRLIALSRTATYMDQALSRLFEIAERDLSRAVLVYLANLGALQARGEDTRGDGVRLRQLFSEALALMGEMRGFPLKERSLELINVYFDQKKGELIENTLLHRLYHKVISDGMVGPVLEPIAAWDEALSVKLEPVMPEMERLQREIVLGSHSDAERERLEKKLLHGLHSHLGRKTIEYLMGKEAPLMSWFFAAYPNRYLMASSPSELAYEMMKFSGFAQADVLVDIVPGESGGSEGLLICTRGVAKSHSRVAYALSRNGLNLLSGKINAVDYADGEKGYCYYFEFARLNPDIQIMPLDLEMMIRTQNLPDPVVPSGSLPYERGGVRVEFRGNDSKGYMVVPDGVGFTRIESDFNHIRLVLRDRPLLFHKVCRAFEHLQVDVRQALITTTGNQVLDYFYLTGEDYERLRHSDFEEICTRMIQGDLLEVTP